MKTNANRMGNLSLLGGVVYLTLAIAFYGSPAHGDTDDIYGPKPGHAWNGKKIYLSAAYHIATPGAQGECQYPNGTNRSERAMARKAAHDVANIDLGRGDDFSGLTFRGYKVRVGQGDPDENTARSNSWGSNAHIPMHSNAVEGAGGTCANRPASNRGTWEIYHGGDGNGLAVEIKQTIDSLSPGTNDKVCNISECTVFSCLIELCSIDAPHAAYSETEFHDWNDGIQFLAIDSDTWTWQFASAIDNFFGRPR